MRHLDLFSGIGGFALAARWTWGEEHKILSFVEIEDYPQKVLKKNFPGVPVLNDIKNVTVNIFANLLYIENDGTVFNIGEDMSKRKDPKYDEAIKLYNAGLSINDCAEFFGITRQAMYKILERRIEKNNNTKG